MNVQNINDMTNLVTIVVLNTDFHISCWGCFVMSISDFGQVISASKRNLGPVNHNVFPRSFARQSLGSISVGFCFEGTYFQGILCIKF